jgi:PAS domain S-box-containing protein
VPQLGIAPPIEPPQLRFHLPLEASHLLRARERLRDYLREYCASRDLIDDVVLCIEEACTNAIRHSAAHDDMQIALGFTGGRLVALVKDSGRGFDTDKFDPHVMPDLRRDHGRGLFIIANLMDELELHCEGGLEVRMTKGAVAQCDRFALESGFDEGSGGRPSHRQTRLRAMLEEIDEGFIGLDWEYRQIHVNETACRMLRCSPDELLGRTPWEVWPMLLGSEVDRSCHEAMELGRPSTVEHVTGAGRWFELRAYPTSAGVSVYLRDISERKRKEAERDRYLADLHESEARSDLLAHVASALLSSDGPQRLVETLCRQVMAHLDCQVFLNFVVDDETDRLHLNACAGIPDNEARRIEWLDYGTAVCGRAARDRVRVVAEQIGTTPDARTDPLRSFGIQAFVCHPLLSQGRLLGTLAFGTRTRDHFSDDALSVMNTVADHVAIAMARTQAVQVQQALDESERRCLDSEERYRRLFESMQEPFCLAEMIRDQERAIDFRYLEANPAFVSLLGREREEVLGKRAQELLPAIDPVWVEVLGRVVATGVATRFCHDSTAFERHFEIFAFRVDADRVGVMVTDATEREEARREREQLVERLQRQHEELQAQSEALRAQTEALRAQTQELRAQAEAARRHTALADALNTIDGLIHSTHDFDEIMRRALEQGAEALRADAGTIEVREESSWVVRYQHGFSADDVGLRQTEAEAPSATRAWATMKPVAVGDLAQVEPLNGGFVRSRGVRSILAAPLIVRQRVTGCLLFYGRRPRTFSEAEIDFVRKLGVTVSLATDNARLYQQEHDVAQVLRAALLKLPGQIAGLRYAHRYHAAVEPAHVGGDFYDLFELDHGLVGVVIGDISGKGLEAAVLTSLVKNTLRAHAAEKGKTPADVVTLTNTVLARETAAEVFATVFFAMLDRRDGRLVYCNAGHPAIAVARVDGEVAGLPATSPLIGAFTDFSYANAETYLACGDLLFLYTDGLTEARRDQDMFGESRVFEMIGRLRVFAPGVVVGRVIDSAVAFAGGGLRDDLAVLALQRLELPGPSQQKLTFT